jgi:hypothetical protein
MEIEQLFLHKGEMVTRVRQGLAGKLRTHGFTVHDCLVTVSWRARPQLRAACCWLLARGVALLLAQLFALLLCEGCGFAQHQSCTIWQTLKMPALRIPSCAALRLHVHVPAAAACRC